MENNELMIGDWVLCKNKPIKVDEILYCGINADWDITIGCKEIMGWEKFDEIKPIKLTSEILKANGFYYDKGGLIWSPYPKELNESCFIYFGLEHNGEISKIEIEDFKVRYQNEQQPFYVHNFQHILKLCGYKNFADGLKIE